MTSLNNIQLSSYDIFRIFLAVLWLVLNYSTVQTNMDKLRKAVTIVNDPMERVIALFYWWLYAILNALCIPIILGFLNDAASAYVLFSLVIVTFCAYYTLGELTNQYPRELTYYKDTWFKRIFRKNDIVPQFFTSESANITANYADNFFAIIFFEKSDHYIRVIGETTNRNKFLGDFLDEIRVLFDKVEVSKKQLESGTIAPIGKDGKKEPPTNIKMVVVNRSYYNFLIKEIEKYEDESFGINGEDSFVN